MALLIALVGIAAVLAALAVAAAITWGKPMIRLAVETYLEQKWQPFQAALSQLSEDVAQLPLTYDQVRRDVRRLHDRAYARVRRTREELASRGLADPELDQMEGELQPLDGDGGEGSGLSLVPQTVAPTAETVGHPTPDDWRRLTLAKKYGLGG